MLSFSPKTVTKELLNELPDRSRRVLVDRFGLTQKGESRTLDAIGQEYGITRERIRQIENHGLASVRDSETYERQLAALEDMKKAMHTLGSVLAEDTLLGHLAKNDADRNHIIFLLTVGHPFDRAKEDADFKTRWHVDAALSEQVENALTALYESLEANRLTPQEEFIELFAKAL